MVNPLPTCSVVPTHLTPLEWIKNCVGTVTVTRPNGVDVINYIIIVDDSFELRDIEECIPATSDKEYTKKLVLKKVH